MTTLSTETLRRAVEIAPGWEYEDTGLGTYAIRYGGWRDMHPQIAKDALAAALVRVVSASGWSFESNELGNSYVFRHGNGKDIQGRGFGPDRTENTISAIVEFASKHPEIFDGKTKE